MRERKEGRYNTGKREERTTSRDKAKDNRSEKKEKFIRKAKPDSSDDNKKALIDGAKKHKSTTAYPEKKFKKNYSTNKPEFEESRKRDTFKKSPAKGGYKRELKKSKTDDGLIRLNKYIANAGICSRREADRLIESGAVSVNGIIITELGTKVSSSDVINFGGQTLRKEKPVYILLNKPKDYITTMDDPEGRKTVMNLIADACRERVYPVGRLDRATTGLLLFTNDGEMAKKLLHPRFGIKKIYHVEVDKNLKKADMEKISEGFELDDGFIKVDAIAYDGDGADKKSLGVEIHTGKNRIVRRIFEHLGYDVKKLDRVYFAGLTKKDLPRGKWRFLTPMEVNMLKMMR